MSSCSFTSSYGDDSWYEDRCKLISGVFATVIQFFLAFVALGTLVVKRFREKPRRPLVVWGMDSGKQVVSMGTAHLTNLATAMVLSTVLGNQQGSPHQCSWYLITFTADCTVGSLSAYIGVQIMQLLARKLKIASLSNSGDYGHPPKASWFGGQLAMWVLIVILGRVGNALVEWVCWNPLNDLAGYIGYPLRNYPKIELTIVMILCPVLLNTFQAWIQDQFLKLGSNHINAKHWFSPLQRKSKQPQSDENGNKGDPTTTTTEAAMNTESLPLLGSISVPVIPSSSSKTIIETSSILSPEIPSSSSSSSQHREMPAVLDINQTNSALSSSPQSGHSDETTSLIQDSLSSKR